MLNSLFGGFLLYMTTHTGLPVAFNYQLDNTNIQVSDQGYIGSCGSNAVASQMAYELDLSPTEAPSRLDLYGTARYVQGDYMLAIQEPDKLVIYTPYDTGSWFFNNYYALAIYGYQKEVHNPYDTDCNSCMSTVTYDNNRIYVDITPKWIGTDPVSIKRELAKGHAVAIGVDFNTQLGIVTEALKIDGIHMTPTIIPHDFNTVFGISGGDHHAMLIVGYDDVKRQFIIQNSWGHELPSYPMYSGYETISYDYPINEAVVIEKIREIK